jgi:DNA polymerase-3 subunit delta
VITLLTGENDFETTRAVMQLVSQFNGSPEKIDGTELELKQFPDLLMGGTLFADTRLVIIKNLSENKTLWAALADWLKKIPDEIHLVLLDGKPDKRTKTYKELQKLARIQEFPLWTERDQKKAESWTVGEAKTLNLTLDAATARLLVERVGVDQWLLYQALQKLAVLDVVTPDIINEVIEANPTENVFNLFEAALKKDRETIERMIEILRLSDDPYRLFGLLSNQSFQLLALGLTERSSGEVAKDIGAHPFALGKLSPYAKNLRSSGVKKVFATFVEADGAMKTSAADPWLLIERALVKITTI